MKEILEKMFKGMEIHERSWVPALKGEIIGHYGKDMIRAMVEACEGNEVEGHLLYLFSYWSNDIQDIAKEHYGLEPGAIVDGKA